MLVFLSLRAIVNHFNPKIESYAAVNHISQLSEEQVNATRVTSFCPLTKKSHKNRMKINFSEHLGAFLGLNSSESLAFKQVLPFKK